MLESSIVAESSGIGAGKVLDKKAHFKEGVIDFTAGSLGIEIMRLNFCLKTVFSFHAKLFSALRWCGIGLR